MKNQPVELPRKAQQHQSNCHFWRQKRPFFKPVEMPVELLKKGEKKWLWTGFTSQRKKFNWHFD